MLSCEYIARCVMLKLKLEKALSASTTNLSMIPLNEDVTIIIKEGVRVMAAGKLIEYITQKYLGHVPGCGVSTCVNDRGVAPRRR